MVPRISLDEAGRQVRFKNRGFVYTDVIRPADEGHTVLDYLCARYPHTDAIGWSARIAAGHVRHGDRAVDAGQRLRRGDRLTWHRPPWIEPDAPLTFSVLHQDADILVVSKPSGLPTVPSGGYLENTLLRLVRERFPTASPMHRLGTGTSGIVVFGLTPVARSGLQAAWRAHQVEKVYRARVCGVPPGDLNRIDVPIGPVAHPLLGSVHAANPQGKPAISHVLSVRPGDDGNAIVDVRIVTGRPHQVRIHMAAAGHPLVGDPLFLPGGIPRETALPTDCGYWLHAMRIAFDHPRTGDRTTVQCAPDWD